MACFRSPTARHEKWMNSVEAASNGGGPQSLRRRAVKIDKAPLACVFIAADAFDVLWGRPRLVAKVFFHDSSAAVFEIQLVSERGLGGWGSPWGAANGASPGAGDPPVAPRCHLPSWQANREGDRERRVSRAKWQTPRCDPIHQREAFITVLNTPMLSEAQRRTARTGSEG